MTEELRAKFFENLITGDEISQLLRLKKLDSYKESFNNGAAIIEDKLQEGWEVDVVLKSKTKLSKPKPNDILFKDRVWSLFARLGFKFLNKESFDLSCDKKDLSAVHNIDILAKDDENSAHN
ncbi:hypothetical protein ACQ86K_03710 [Mucilaginibacter sp. P19]|uniref:hypothetical protein n=1 Tax=Mucilaginibacter sp. P19 TaxID=3423947 RepID=UPI003D667598